MICEIEPPHSNPAGPLGYNERKTVTLKDEQPAELNTTRETPEQIATLGYVVADKNIPEGCTLESEIERLRNLAMAKRTKRGITLESFHMSVNPSATDRELSDKDAEKFINELMERLGYGQSPYRIYKHQDIARGHYHVVSSRIGQDGKKIKDTFERLQLHSVLLELSEKYGFTVEETRYDKKRTEKQNRKEGKKEPVKEPERKSSNKTGAYVPPFRRDSDESVTQQIADAHEDAMQWHFSTFEQYQMLMRARYSVDVEYHTDDTEYHEDSLLYSGLENGMVRVTPVFPDAKLDIDKEEIMKKCASERMSEKKAQKSRLEKAVRESMDAATTYSDLHKEMKKRGVAMTVSWSKDGQPFGVTYFDYATKCIWKGSETATDLRWLKTSCEQNGLAMVQGKREKPVVQKKDVRSVKQMPAPTPAVKTPTAAGQERKPSVGKNATPGSLLPTGTHAVNVGSKDMTDKKSEDEIMEEIRLGLR